MRAVHALCAMRDGADLQGAGHFLIARCPITA